MSWIMPTMHTMPIIWYSVFDNQHLVLFNERFGAFLFRFWIYYTFTGFTSCRKDDWEGGRSCSGTCTVSKISVWHLFPGSVMCLFSCGMLQCTQCQSEGRIGPFGMERPPSLVIFPCWVQLCFEPCYIVSWDYLLPVVNTVAKSSTSKQPIRY